MTTAIERLPLAEEPVAATVAPVPQGSGAARVHQALCWFPDHRGTGLTLTEHRAEAALRNNAQLPPEPITAVRLKIRTDGAGVRFAKRATGSGDWELTFTPLDPWLCDIVEHVGADGDSTWHVVITRDVALSWTGGWDDRPAIDGLWIGSPWLRMELVP